MGALVPFNDKQLALIRRTVAKDCDAAEFDWAVSICKATGLDPLRRQIYFFVFNKDDPAKRNMVPVVAIGGYRSMAERTGNYRPGKTTTHFDETAKDPLCNPLGVSHATATVWKFSHGEWFEIEASAYWSEFAPIKTDVEGGFDWIDTGETWPDTGKPKKKKVPRQAGAKQVSMLDPTKDGWRKMPRIMIEKCAEALALRKAWPDDFSGLYGEGELDRAEALDMTPSEMANASEREDRMAKLGGLNAIMIQWEPNAPIERVPTGRFADLAMAFIGEHMKRGQEEPSAIMEWADRNRHSIRDYWARDKDGALALKTEIEKVAQFMAQPMAAE